MTEKKSSYNILVGKHVANTGLIINQALIDLLLEKGVFSVEELRSKIVDIRKEVDKKDTYKSKF